MNKKLVIIGRGTAGCYALSHFHRWTDWNIELIYDSNIPQQAVGEGAALGFPVTLFNNLNFRHFDLKKIHGSPKLGIYKKYWTENTFTHDFLPPALSYHFNAIALQDYILDQLKDSKRITLTDSNLDKNNVDADFIMDCSGRPKTFEDFHVLDDVMVNSVYVTQCPTTQPSFDTTLTIARKHGWVFGIPLQNRCSIGYLYNNNHSTLDEVKQDVKNVFSEFNLTPSDTTNQFSFSSYRRKNNFVDNKSFNGNASFFIEPLEATSISTMDRIQRWSFDLWNNNKSIDQVNEEYHIFLEQVEHMILMHYLPGSTFDTSFWKEAKLKSENNMRKAMKKEYWQLIIRSMIDKVDYLEHNDEYGTWPFESYKTNIRGLDIQSQLEKIYYDTQRT